MADPDALRPHSTLEHAHVYAQLGLRVLPIKPGSKRPPMREWVEAATTDAAMIRNWFTGPLYSDHGVGLAMGRQPNGVTIFALDVDEHDPACSGGETLADLEAEHGPLPDTVRSITGSGGMHLLFAVPDDRVVRNGVAGDGLDVRGEGGQIVVAPSVHPATGALYEWEDGCAPWECDIAVAPAWLLDLVADGVSPAPSATNPPAAPASPVFTDPDSPAEWLRSQWDWPLQLRDAGWIEHHTDRRTGDTHWTRPGKDQREGASGVLHPGGPFVVFSTDASVAHLRATGRLNRDGSVSLSPFEFYAAHRHGGDVSAAGRAIAAMMAPADSRLSVDPAESQAAAAVKPRKLRLTSAASIPLRRVRWLWDARIAAGTLSLLAGPEGLGKSTVAYWLASRITRGELPGEDHGKPRSVLVCATEDSWEHTIAPRLHAHGADLTRVFRMEVEVDGAVTAELILPADLADVEEAAADTDASLLILDPLMSRLNAKLDAHRDGEVRLALEPLVRSCEKADIACLGLIHHNKSGSTNPLDLVMASKAFTAVARSVHTVIRDPEDETGETRMFGTVKNNLGRMDLPTPTFAIHSWSYPTIDGETGTVGQLQWGPDSATSIAVALKKANVDSSRSAMGAAMDWLRAYMKQHGPRVNSGDVYQAGDVAGHSRTTLKNARRKLGYETEDVSTFGPRQTYWFDPTDSRLSADDDGPDDSTPTLEDIK